VIAAARQWGYCFIASCELAMVDPLAWFQDVLTRIRQHSMQQLDDLLLNR
jgi:hypothetical protein